MKAWGIKPWEWSELDPAWQHYILAVEQGTSEIAAVDALFDEREAEARANAQSG